MELVSSASPLPFPHGAQVASVTNSPLITQYISSPIVARAQSKDPAERNRLAESLAKGDLSKVRAGTGCQGVAG